MTLWARYAAQIGVFALAGALATGCDRDDTDEEPPTGADPDDKESENEPREEAPPDDAGAAPESDDVGDDDALRSPFLWRATSPDGEREGYLFGTMHLGVDAEAVLPDAFWEKLAGADIFAMETDISDMMGSFEAFSRADGPSLREEIGEEAWETLEEIVGPAQARVFDELKPAAAAMAISAEPLPTTPPMDLVIQRRAEEKGLELAYLEELDLQLDLFTRYYTGETLVSMLENFDEVRELTKSGLEAYRAGDGEELEGLIADPAHWADAPEGALEDLLYERNENWIPEIVSLFERGEPFIAVGAGHLVGERNVVALLEEEGYELERLSFE